MISSKILEEKLVYLERNQEKREQNNRRNKVELTDISYSISDKELENTMIRIFKTFA